jgi:MFS family permease
MADSSGDEVERRVYRGGGGATPVHDDLTLQRRVDSPPVPFRVATLGAERASQQDFPADDDDVEEGGAQPSFDERDALVASNEGAARRDLGDYGSAGGGGEYFTCDDAIESVRYGSFQRRLLFICSLAFIADMAMIVSLSFLLPSVREEWGLSRAAEASLASSMFFGMMIGASAWGRVSDRSGRRPAIIGSAVLTFVTLLLMAFAPGVRTLAALEFFAGVGVGGAHVVFSLYAEFLPVHNRGVRLLALQCAMTLGGCLEVCLAWAVLPTHGWRVLMPVTAVPMLLLISLGYYIPESPRLHAVAGRCNEAHLIYDRVARINRRSLPAGRLVVHAPGSAAAQAAAASGGGGGGARGIAALFHPNLRRTTIVLAWCWFACVLLYYGIILVGPNFLGVDEDIAHAKGTKVIKNNKRSSIAFGDMLISNVAEFPGVIGAAYLVNRLGRQPTMFGLFILTAATLSTLFLWQRVPHGYIVTSITFSRLFASATFAVIYTFSNEVYPTAVRSTGMGFASSFARLAGLATPFIAEELWEFGFQWPVTIYVIAALLAAVLVLFLPLDTKDLALADSVEDMVTSAAYVEAKQNEAADSLAESQALLGKRIDDGV